MIIPWQELEEQTLQNIVEAFVLREGTDYGEQELSLEEKCQALLTQIRQGKVIVVYSELHESVNLLPYDQYKGSQS